MIYQTGGYFVESPSILTIHLLDYCIDVLPETAVVLDFFRGFAHRLLTIEEMIKNLIVKPREVWSLMEYLSNNNLNNDITCGVRSSYCLMH